MSNTQLKASSQQKLHTAAHMGRLFAPAAWISLPFFQCPLGMQKCQWGRDWVWRTMTKHGLSEDRSGTNAAKVTDLSSAKFKLTCILCQMLSANLQNPLSKCKMHGHEDCTKMATTQYAQPLLSAKTVKMVQFHKQPKVSKLCLTKFAIQEQSRRLAQRNTAQTGL